MRPPTNRDHSTAFWTIMAFNLFVTVLWIGWTVDTLMKQVADPVTEMRWPE